MRSYMEHKHNQYDDVCFEVNGLLYCKKHDSWFKGECVLCEHGL